MKIAIVCYPTFGGSGVVATELGLELAKKGHEIHFITYSQPVRLALLNSNLHYHEVHVPEYPLFHYQPYELALSSKLVDMVKLYDIEVLHVHYAIPHAYAGYMAKKMLEDEGIKIPMITTLHGTDITLVGNHPFYKPAVSFSINKSDFVTSVSSSLRDDTYRLFDIKKEIVVIPNFIEPNKFASDEVKKCNRSMMANENEKIITHISNFRKVKSVADGSQSSLTSNGNTYSDITKTKVILNLKITTEQTITGFPNPIEIPIMAAQDVLVSTQYYSKNIGMVYNQTNISYTLNTLPPQFQLPIPSSGSQTQEEFLDVYQVN